MTSVTRHTSRDTLTESKIKSFEFYQILIQNGCQTKRDDQCKCIFSFEISVE